MEKIYKELHEQCQNLTVLYAEDEIDIQENLADILSKLFKEVLCVSNGLEGIDVFRANNSIDLVITDLNMPIKNGYEMSQEIRELNQEIPIIVISAISDTDYFLNMITLGIDAYLVKPLEQKQFINTLHRITKKILHKQTYNQYQEKLEEEISKKTQELEDKYYTDDLTKLKNRYSLLNDISQFNSSKIILIDINKFSALNDVYGSDIGDQILKIVAGKLSRLVNKNCTLYRVSDDQFVFLSLKDYTDNECKEHIINITNLLNNNSIHIPIDNTDIEINLTVTIAVAKDVSNNRLLECADTALHYAKITNQHYVIYTKELEKSMNHQKRFKAVKLVKKALEDNRLVPFFQPIVKKDEITYECLVRIIAEDGTIIPPFEFVEEVKNTPYYTQLTKTMIDKSFRYFKNNNHSFSINLSFEDISNTLLIQYLKEQLALHQVHNQLILEILESESINNFEIVKSFIHEMKILGVRIAIDDFGSGYSNFSYLLELEPDFIKIDGSIIKNIATDYKSYAIAKTIVTFSQELGIKTIAEYIYNEDVLDKVNELKIDGKQGYILGKPNANI